MRIRNKYYTDSIKRCCAEERLVIMYWSGNFKSCLTELLSEEIYKPIKEAVSPEEWKAFITIHEQNNYASITTQEWKLFANIVDRLLKETTANRVASVVAKDLSGKAYKILDDGDQYYDYLMPLLFIATVQITNMDILLTILC